MRREGGGVKEVQGGTLQMPFSGFYKAFERPKAWAKADGQCLGQGQ